MWDFDLKRAQKFQSLLCLNTRNGSSSMAIDYGYVLNVQRIIPTSSFGTYSSYEVKERFINPRSLLKHLNNQSSKNNSHVYKR